MKAVTIKKKELIKILKKNRDAHAEEYKEAYEGYKMTCIEELEARLEKVKNGEDFNMNFIDVREPDNHVEDYQNVIDMLEVGEEKSVQISMEQYLKYYKNKWEWHRSWEMSNAHYIGKFKGA